MQRKPTSAQQAGRHIDNLRLHATHGWENIPMHGVGVRKAGVGVVQQLQVGLARQVQGTRHCTFPVGKAHVLALLRMP